jgi:hypothetical protein
MTAQASFASTAVDWHFFLRRRLAGPKTTTGHCTPAKIMVQMRDPSSGATNRGLRACEVWWWILVHSISDRLHILAPRPALHAEPYQRDPCRRRQLRTGQGEIEASSRTQHPTDAPVTLLPTNGYFVVSTAQGAEYVLRSYVAPNQDPGYPTLMTDPWLVGPMGKAGGIAGSAMHNGSLALPSIGHGSCRLSLCPRGCSKSHRAFLTSFDHTLAHPVPNASILRHGLPYSCVGSTAMILSCAVRQRPSS